MRDPWGREINYLRVSVTDACDLRCRYCMPGDAVHEEPLRREELLALIAAVVDCGIETVRFTGGEPLARPDLPELIRSVRAMEGVRRVAMTTNATLLASRLPKLLEAGLESVNISLDSLQRDTYRTITGRDRLASALEGLDAAVESGLETKVNVVPQPGYNDGELAQLALLARDRPVQVRFIEMMPIGLGVHEPCLDTRELLERFQALWPDMERQEDHRGDGPAVYYHVPGWKGCIGFISAVHGKFCAQCNRVRLTSQGILRLCLASEVGVDVLSVLRSGTGRDALAAAVRQGILQKPKEHHFSTAEGEKTKEMYRIGG